MNHQKLVRDKIPEIIRKEGRIPICYTLEEKDYKKELDRKLQEEVTEYLKDDTIEELADIIEVIEAILDYKQITLDNFRKIKQEKRNKKGGFKKRIFLEETIENEKERKEK